MLVLFETAAGYAVFKLLDDNKLSQSENLYLDFQTPEAANKLLKLKHFEKFKDTAEALVATTAAIEGKLCKTLKKMLKKHCLELQEQLAVADTKLGSAIKNKLNLPCVSNTAVQELMRCIRCQMDSLLVGQTKKEMTAMALGLSHSLSRYKLKFSSDKVDTMVIQAIGLLDELDKELNNYAMRCREWYGWHFPELSKIVTDNNQFMRTVRLLGMRENAVNCDLSDILSEEVEYKLKEAAEVSMGTEVSEEDILNIQCLCDQVIDISQYRTELYNYLKARMMALAPNLTILVGELVGARLMSRAGSLINLAKHPASTVQILGAEKALFRALKTKKDTPKYGLIYHAQLIGQTSFNLKGKMSRKLAAKTSLVTRFDALGECETPDTYLGKKHRTKLEQELRSLEAGNHRKISGSSKAKAKFEKYHFKSEFIQYSASADSTLPSTSKKGSKKPLIQEIETSEDTKKKIEDTEEVHKEKRKKKRKHGTDDETTKDKEDLSSTQQELQTKSSDNTKTAKRKQSLKHKAEEAEEDISAPSVSKKKKKKSKQGTLETEGTIHTRSEETELKEASSSKAKTSESGDISAPSVSKKKKKRSKQETLETEETIHTGSEETELKEASSSKAETFESGEPKKKKKRKKEKDEKAEEVVMPTEVEESTSSEKKKKKKKKSHPVD